MAMRWFIHSIFHLVLEKVVLVIKNISGSVNFDGPIKEFGCTDDLELMETSREEDRDCFCSLLLITGKRVSLEVNEGKTKCLSCLEYDKTMTLFRWMALGLKMLANSPTFAYDVTNFEVNARIRSSSFFGREPVQTEGSKILTYLMSSILERHDNSLEMINGL